MVGNNKRSYNNMTDKARHRRIQAMRKKRRRQVFIRKCVIAAAGVLVVSGAIRWCVDGKDKDSNIVENETYAIAADIGNMNSIISKGSIVSYAGKSSNYIEITDEAVYSPYIALVEVESGQVIAGRNCNDMIYPASMTKIMTLIVAVQEIKDYNRSYTFQKELLNDLYLDEATVAGFEEGETVTVDDLLYGLILPSGADSAIAMARMISGTESAFAELMNDKCNEMGLKNTHFVNPTGLHDEQQYTTPAEMAMIMEVAMSNPVCARYLSAYQHTTAATEQHPDGILLTSTMFSRMYGNEVEGVTISAGKTGYTDEALHCLVSFAQKDGKHYIAVEAGAQDKWYTIFDSFKMFDEYAL